MYNIDRTFSEQIQVRLSPNVMNCGENKLLYIYIKIFILLRLEHASNRMNWIGKVHDEWFRFRVGHIREGLKVVAVRSTYELEMRYVKQN